MLRKKWFATIALFVFTLLLSLPPISATSKVPLTWEGQVMALGGKLDSSHYSFRATNMTIEDRGSYYIVHENVSFYECLIYRNGTVTARCPVKEKEVTFLVKKDTNTFMLANKPVFFFQYWPEFSLNNSVYSSGIELKPIPVELYLKNNSPENRIGWVVTLQSGPIKVLRCTGWSLPENPTDLPRCIDEGYRNFSINMDFRGPYLVDGSIYLPADPFGIIKNQSVIISISVEDTPEAREFLRNVRSISPPSNSSWHLYLIGAGVIGGVLISALKLRRR